MPDIFYDHGPGTDPNVAGGRAAEFYAEIGQFIVEAGGNCVDSPFATNSHIQEGIREQAWIDGIDAKLSGSRGVVVDVTEHIGRLGDVIGLMRIHNLPGLIVYQRSSEHEQGPLKELLARSDRPIIHYDQPSDIRNDINAFVGAIALYDN